MGTREFPIKRVDWWKVLTDLQYNGYSLPRLSEQTLIPHSTLNCFKNQDAEPRHYDGETILIFWRRVMPVGTELPTQQPRLRQRSLRG